MEFLLHKTPPYSVYKKVKTSEALSTNAAILSIVVTKSFCVDRAATKGSEMQPSYSILQKLYFSYLYHYKQQREKIPALCIEHEVIVRLAKEVLYSKSCLHA